MRLSNNRYYRIYRVLIKQAESYGAPGAQSWGGSMPFTAQPSIAVDTVFTPAKPVVPAPEIEPSITIDSRVKAQMQNYGSSYHSTNSRIGMNPTLAQDDRRFMADTANSGARAMVEYMYANPGVTPQQFIRSSGYNNTAYGKAVMNAYTSGSYKKTPDPVPKTTNQTKPYYGANGIPLGTPQFRQRPNR